MFLFLIDKLAGAVVTLPLLLLFTFLTDRKRVTKKWIWVSLFAVYMNAMLIIVGVPYFEHITWDMTINLIPFHDFSSSNILGMILNIVMFVPFGAFLTIYFKQFRKLVPTAIAGFIMSLFIEILQLFTFRATDIDDLIMNTLGCVVGYGMAKLILRKKDDTEEVNRDVIKLVGMILVSVWVVVFVHGKITSLIWPLLEV